MSDEQLLSPLPLSPREGQVFTLLVQGYTTKQIAGRLGASPRTVEVHRRHIVDKAGARNSTDAVHRLTLARRTWRGRGAEVRTLAEGMTGAQARQLLMTIAESYLAAGDHERDLSYFAGCRPDAVCERRR